MRVYRETRSLGRPPRDAARAVFGDADRRERTERHAAGLVRTAVAISDTDGTLRTDVHVAGVGALTALAVLGAAIGAFVPGVRVAALWACALVVLLPTIYLSPTVVVRPDVGRVEDRRITTHTAPAYVAALYLLWASLRPLLGPSATVLCGSVLAVGLGCYAVGGGCRTASVSSTWLAVAGLLPLVVTVANLAVAAALVRTSGVGRTSIAGAVVFATLSALLLVAYGWLVHEAVRDATFAPMGSTGGRSTALLAYLAVVFGLSLATVDITGQVAAAVPLPVVALLCLPMGLPVGGGLYHAVETALTRRRAVRRADVRTVEDATVHVVDSNVAFVRATSFPRTVFVTRAVLQTLSDEEFLAVLAHERHHLRRRDRTLRVAASLASLVVGRNALLAFLDYPARERAADTHAADVAGPEALVRALRRLESLESPPVPAPNPLSAPYSLLYGAAPAAATHPPVEERIAAVTG